MICPHTECKIVTVFSLTIEQLQISVCVKSLMTNFSRKGGVVCWFPAVFNDHYYYYYYYYYCYNHHNHHHSLSIIIFSLLIPPFLCVSSEGLGAANQYLQHTAKHRANYTEPCPRRDVQTHSVGSTEPPHFPPVGTAQQEQLPWAPQGLWQPGWPAQALPAPGFVVHRVMPRGAPRHKWLLCCAKWHRSCVGSAPWNQE